MLKMRVVLAVVALAFAGAGFGAEVLPAPRDITYMSSNNDSDYNMPLNGFDGRNTTGTFRFAGGVIVNSNFTYSRAFDYSYYRNAVLLNDTFDNVSFNYSDMQGATMYNGSARNTSWVGVNARAMNILGMDLRGVHWKRYNLGGVEPVWVLGDITDRRMQPKTIHNSVTTCPTKTTLCDIIATEKGFGWYLRERKTAK